jgi:hypothetical protein
MDKRIPVDEATSLAWVEGAHKARLAHHMLKGTPDPTQDSNFAQIKLFIPKRRPQTGTVPISLQPWSIF